MVEKSLKYNEIEKLPTFILGDFNAQPGWEEMEPIEKCETYQDVTDHIPATFHGFFKVPQEKIDYIFVNDLVKAVSCDKWESEEGHICLSDHFPIGLVCEI